MGAARDASATGFKQLSLTAHRTLSATSIALASLRSLSNPAIESSLLDDSSFMGLSVSNSSSSASSLIFGCSANLNPFFLENNKEQKESAVASPALAVGFGAEVRALAHSGATVSDVVWLGVLGPS
ncbi:hypothetical protein PVAR5_3340 [Paecilomyces variotii No. 5]|uniref:Uncharacterized protein n=1 Tax=Byssochlamys spectabilis (strain No. 5 / NBRC 109023) TaxID=1356009 RepID=V5FY87_BYSSN|nr:hypothetical protein PVAR5_3340 [Paecilomyces variotii No. 5]